MRTQTINLECEMEVIINHDSKTICERCGAEILFAKTKTNKYIPIELVSLAKWDIHNCEVEDEH